MRGTPPVCYGTIDVGGPECSTRLRRGENRMGCWRGVSRHLTHKAGPYFYTF